MPRLNREDECKITPVYLGKGSIYKYGPILDHVKTNMGLKNFIVWALLLYKKIYMKKN